MGVQISLISSWSLECRDSIKLYQVTVSGLSVPVPLFLDLSAMWIL